MWRRGWVAKKVFVRRRLGRGLFERVGVWYVVVDVEVGEARWVSMRTISSAGRVRSVGVCEEGEVNEDDIVDGG